MSRAELVAKVCKDVPDERLALLIEFGGLKRCVDMIDWDLPDPDWTERERRAFMESLQQFAVRALKREHKDTQALITAGTYSPRVCTVLVTLGRRLAESAPDVQQAIEVLLDLNPEEVQAFMEWAKATQTWDEFRGVGVGAD